MLKCFNPRPRVGGDRPLRRSKIRRQGFNPRPRVGGDIKGGEFTHSVVSFNPRPRVGGDSSSWAFCSIRSRFQSTPPGGGRRRPVHPHPTQLGVSIHAPGWGATNRVGRLLLNGHVSIHAPGWGATSGCGSTSSSALSFNPRPRVGGDFEGLLGVRLVVVSIHAPGWGATWGGGQKVQWCQIVSIHAPGWGATSLARIATTMTATFQSTPPGGGRRGQKLAERDPRGVSIHAPGWGATRLKRRVLGCPSFQSTPPGGGRLLAVPPWPRVAEFQSTPPGGGRPSRSGASLRLRWFQSTPPGGGRPVFEGALQGCATFQSTPPGGGRLDPMRCDIKQHCVSIHAPGWGATHGVGEIVVARRVSIHAPGWGATVGRRTPFGRGLPRQTSRTKGNGRLKSVQIPTLPSLLIVSTCFYRDANLPGFYRPLGVRAKE